MALSTESRFFGLDLTQIKADVLKTWRKAPQWPPLSWLQPEQALTLLPAEGEPVVVWQSGGSIAGGKRTLAATVIQKHWRGVRQRARTKRALRQLYDGADRDASVALDDTRRVALMAMFFDVAQGETVCLFVVS